MNSNNSAAMANIIYLAKFSKSAYSYLTDDKLSRYAQDVISKIKDNPAYASFEKLLANLVAAQTAYSKALEVVVKGGSQTQFLQKNEAKTALIIALNDFENQMNLEAKGIPTFITNAGFNCWKKPQKSIPTPPPVPTVVSLIANPMSKGVVTAKLQYPTGTKVDSAIPSVSFDNGMTFTPYTLIPSRGGNITGLPSGQTVLIKFASVQRAKTSENTVPAPVMAV